MDRLLRRRVGAWSAARAREIRPPGVVRGRVGGGVPRWVRAAALVLVAGTCSAALGQGRALYPDESVVARDGLVRVRELAAAGNTPEAIRVLQDVLEREADRVLPSPGDADLFWPVREHAHALLRSEPALLEAYRSIQGPRARALLEAGEAPAVERAWLLTPAGFDAALIVADEALRSARFHHARRVLESVATHPDRVGPGARRAAALARMLTAYIPDPALAELAASWSREAGEDAALPERIEPPDAARRVGRSPMDPAPALADAGLSPRPLQSIPLSAEGLWEEQDPSLRGLGRMTEGEAAWVLPTVVDTRVYINDGVRVAALDAATLAEQWAVIPPEPMGRTRDPELMNFTPTVLGPRALEDAATVAVGEGIALGITGTPIGGERLGDPRVHALDASTGAILWSGDPAFLATPAIDGASARGLPVIDGGVAVVALRRAAAMRRVSSLHMVGVEAATGRPLWSRAIASVGTQPWARTQNRPDGMLAVGGLVIRGDEMGLVAAVESATGRPVWVRRGSVARQFDPQQWRQVEAAPPWEMHVPVPLPPREGHERGSVLAIEPGRGSILELDLRDGSIIARREGSAFGDPRYLLLAGEHLVAVGPLRVATVPLESWSTGPVAYSTLISAPGFSGRVVASGDRLLGPVPGGMSIIDPANPQGARLLPLDAAGTPLVVASGGSSHLLVAGARTLSSFLGWDQARALMDARVAASPGDPAPLLTYVELLARAGAWDEVPAMADRALAVLDERRDEARSLAARGRLFEMLERLVRASREADATTQTEAEGEFRDPVLREPRLVAEVIERMSRAAETTREEALVYFERGSLRERVGDARGAVADYQAVLLDADLSAVVVEDRSPSGPGIPEGAVLPPMTTTAAHEARRRVLEVVARAGAEAYAPYEAPAQAALDAAMTLEGTQAERALALERVAEEFPASGSAWRAWEAAAQTHAQAASPVRARRAWGQALRSAEASRALGRPDGIEGVGRSASRLLASLRGSHDEALLRLSARLTREHPDLDLDAVLREAGLAAGRRELEDSAREAALARTGLARIGLDMASDVQALEGWAMLEPLVADGPGQARDAVAVYAEGAGVFGVLASSPEDGRLGLAWSRAAAVRPTVVAHRADGIILFWPTSGGGTIERVDPLGQTLWTTPELTRVLGDPSTDRVQTPLDGSVRADDLVVTGDATTVALVRRLGRAAAIDVATGQVRWTASTGLSRVHDAQWSSAGNGTLVVGGTTMDQGVSRGSVACIDGASGRVAATVDPSLLGQFVRWVVRVPGPDGAAGADVAIATNEGLVLAAAQSGRVRWHQAGGPAAGAIAGWSLAGSLFVLDPTSSLWRIDVGSGQATGPLESRGPVRFPVAGRVTRHGLVVATAQGLAVYGPDGSLLGADAMGLPPRVGPAAVAEDAFVSLEAARDGDPDEPADAGSRLFILDNPSGRIRRAQRVILPDDPREVRVLDGKILIGLEDLIVAIDVPR